MLFPQNIYPISNLQENCKFLQEERSKIKQDYQRLMNDKRKLENTQRTLGDIDTILEENAKKMTELEEEDKLKKEEKKKLSMEIKDIEEKLAPLQVLLFFCPVHTIFRVYVRMAPSEILQWVPDTWLNASFNL